MRKEVVYLGLILLVVGLVLALYTVKVYLYYNYEFGVSGVFDGEDDVGYYNIVHPYGIVGSLVMLVGIVTFVIGGYMPNQSTSDTVT